MSPFFLIQPGTLHERAGVTSNRHFILIPARLRSLSRCLLNKLPEPAVDGKARHAAETRTHDSTPPPPMTVTVDLHPLDHAALQEAARAVGMDAAAFCALAIHRASRSVVEQKPFQPIV